ncbi:MAG TPA: glycosyltransferase, partial [Planctomycetia bacterium]|nr:glycosyltransferase [Planctomycetia bacterium]
EKAHAFLTDVYGISAANIDLIAHGIPDVPFVDPAFYKDQFGVEGKVVALTFGLLSPNKGVEHMLHAVPAIAARFPKFMYVILGATHPNLVRQQGDTYRHELERLVRRLGIEKHVTFFNRFVELKELTEFLNAADVYVTPYLNPAQAVSGTLAYAFGCGKAVVSTPYWHAEELLAEGRGELVPFADSQALADKIIGLLSDEDRRNAIRKRAYILGREMIWSNVSRAYTGVFLKARRSRVLRPRLRTMADRAAVLPLPDWRFDHLVRMSDSTGVFQHAVYDLPRFHEGYCTDDNARALLVTVLVEECGLEKPSVENLASSYAAFLNLAWDHETRRFRNFMSFDRRWLEKKCEVNDSFGRALWALGTCVGRSRRQNQRHWAVSMFEAALPEIEEAQTLRPCVFALLGITEYLTQLPGDRLVCQIRDRLLRRLHDALLVRRQSDWIWFENMVTYDNARLPQALILAGHSAENEEAVQDGLKALRWLMDAQRAPDGHFRPVGSEGFWSRHGERAQFDQQPLEAAAAVSACLSAYRIVQEPRWLEDARTAFEWFLGRNDLGIQVYDPYTGGCRDGLLEDRVNQNQGAESTLAFLAARAEMTLAEDDTAAFTQRADAETVPV